MLSVGNDKQFVRCAEILGLAQLASDPRFQTNGARVRNRDELIPLLEDAFACDSSEAWLAKLSEASVPCGPILDIGEVFESDYATEAGIVQHQIHPLNDELPTIANPVRYSETPVTYEKAPPMLGQHTDEVLAEWLGYSARQIDDLHSAGAIQNLRG